MTTQYKEPLVSVIVPAYNCGAYIAEALASLSNQTVRDIEIIVVDDASTDHTADVAAAHAAADPRIRLIRRQSASGRPSCARNDGLRAARGEYVALLDADDVSLPTRLASCVAAMRRTGAHFAFADYQHLHQATGNVEAQSVLRSMRFLEKTARYMDHVDGDTFLCPVSFRAFLLTSTPVNTPTVVFKRELVVSEALWFDESIVCSEDVDLWFRFAEHTPFVFVNEIHSLNRRHSASLTARNQRATRVDAITVRRAHLKRLRHTLSHSEAAAADSALAQMLWGLAYWDWCDGNPRDARVGFLQSWRTRPTIGAFTGFLKAFFPRRFALVAMDWARRRRSA